MLVKKNHMNTPFKPPFWLKNGLLMTWYVSWKMGRLKIKELNYQEHVVLGAQKVPLVVKVAIPENPKATIIGTYGITGSLENQTMLKILALKAYEEGFAVVLFDWRGHGKSAELSATLTSDGIYEGDDFIAIAKTAQNLGCPVPFWLTGYSLGGQLALWGLRAAQISNTKEIAGGAVICPSLDSERSLTYLGQSITGRWIEKSITKELKQIARNLAQKHPQSLNIEVIEKIKDIRSFDQELVISKLGFQSASEYYNATNTLNILPELTLPTLIIYAADDPLFDPSIISDLQTHAADNPQITLLLSEYGGHVGYLNQKIPDEDPWWAWNRVLDFCS